MTYTTPTTVTLRSGITVLAKTTKFGTFAATYANRTQANNAAAKFGGYVIQHGRPFLVRFDNAA